MKLAWTIAVALLLPLAAEAAQAPAKRVLVVHDGDAARRPGDRDAVEETVALLGHFECEVTTVAAEGYRSGGASGHDAVIYLGLREGAALPRALLADCYDSEQPVCWVGANLGQLAARFSLGRYGFALASASSQSRPRRVVYHDRQLRRVGQPLPEIAVTRPAGCQVVATAEGDGGPLPYVIRSGNFWYFAEVPRAAGGENASHLVFCDQLHEVLEERHTPRRLALLCLTRVSADTDAGHLSMLVNYVESEGLPFAVSVIPVFRDPEADRGIELSSRRGLVGVLRGAQADGASIIAHGLSRPPPGIADGRARRGAGGEIGDLLEDALEELGRCGLYPVAWTAHSDWVEAEDAMAFAQLYSTRWQQPAGSGGRGGPPYLVEADRYGQRVISSNLPLLREGKGEVEVMLAEAREQAIVGDPWVTVSIDPAAPVAAVELLVKGLREAGYEFVDLRCMDNWTKGEELHVHTVSAPRAAGELIPEGWHGAVMGPRRGERAEFERPGRDGRSEAALRPGALLLAYPEGKLPRPVFAFEGGAAAASRRWVYGLARVVVFFGVAACGLLMLIYVMQVIIQRRA